MKKISAFFIFFICSLNTFSQVLGVNQVIQEQTNWCWSATSVCVLNYYCYNYSQCEIAEYARSVNPTRFGTTNCCVNPVNGCNTTNFNYGYLGSIKNILITKGNISNTGIASPLSKQEITSDILNNRLSIILWDWTNGGGHFLVCHGLIGNNLYYMNPLEGLLIGDYDWVYSASDHVWSQTNRVDLTPNVSLVSPAGPISGLNIVCPNQNSVIYTVPPITNATSYIWTLPNGASGSSSTNSITVNFGGTAVSGNISVCGYSSCGRGRPSNLPIQVNYNTITSSPVSVCQGQSGIIMSNGSCSDSSNTATNLLSGSWSASSNQALRPNTMSNSAICSFSPSLLSNYNAILFQVTKTGSYTFLMANSTAYDGMGYITTQPFVPGNCNGGGSWIIGDDDGASAVVTGSNEPRMTVMLNAGTTYKLISTTYSSSNNIIQNNFSWNITEPSGGQVVQAYFSNAGNIINGSWDSVTDSLAVRPNAFINNDSTNCFFTTGTSAIKRNYNAIIFKVNKSGIYTFQMVNNSAYDGMGYITDRFFIPGVCDASAWFVGDDDGAGAVISGSNEPRIKRYLESGVYYKLISTTYGATSGTVTNDFAWTISGPIGGQIMLTTTPACNWYNVASGGSPIFVGNNFNPVGVTGSGLSNTNTVGSTTYYVACSSNNTCRLATTFTVLPSPSAVITPIGPTNICAGTSVLLSANTGIGLTYQWKKDAVNITGANTSSYSASVSGSYTVSVTNSSNCIKTSSPVQVNVIPSMPNINWNGTQFSTNATGVTYQWYFANAANPNVFTPISGATSSTYTPTSIGNYQLQVTSGGCTSTGNNYNLIVTGINPTEASSPYVTQIFPNPASNDFAIKFGETPETTVELQLVNNIGSVVKSIKTKSQITTMKVNELASGVYYLKIIGGNYNQTKKVQIIKHK